MEKRIKASAFYLGHVEISNKWLTNRELVTKIKDKRIKAYIFIQHFVLVWPCQQITTTINYANIEKF